MWNYEKRLQYPVHIQTTNPRLAQIIIAQYGGPDGEIGASLRYLSQRYTMPCPELKAILTDIGTEELALKWWRPSCTNSRGTSRRSRSAKADTAPIL
jgi:Mn-containing catalase